MSLISDASIRFERQVDETGCVDVANVACALIEEIAGGEVAPGYVDVFPAPKTIDSIKLRLARVHAICGADIERFGFLRRGLHRSPPFPFPPLCFPSVSFLTGNTSHRRTE